MKRIFRNFFATCHAWFVLPFCRPSRRALSDEVNLQILERLSALEKLQRERNDINVKTGEAVLNVVGALTEYTSCLQNSVVKSLDKIQQGTHYNSEVLVTVHQLVASTSDYTDVLGIRLLDLLRANNVTPSDLTPDDPDDWDFFD
jgi:uncharacterized protein YllA (UPF0747 family)